MSTELFTIVTITHTPTGFYYLGKSHNPKQFLKDTKRTLRAGKHHNTGLQILFTDVDTLSFSIDYLDKDQLEEEYYDRTHRGCAKCLNVLRIPSNKESPACYILTHVKTGNFYIGSTNNIARRLSKHKSQLNKGTSRNRGLRKLNAPFSEFVIEIFKCETKEIALETEKMFLNRYYQLNNCLNNTPNVVGGATWDNNPTYRKNRVGHLTFHRNKKEDMPEELKRKQKPLMIQGKYYSTVEEVCSEYSLSFVEIAKRLFDTDDEYPEWRFASDTEIRQNKT